MRKKHNFYYTAKGAIVFITCIFFITDILLRPGYSQIILKKVTLRPLSIEERHSTLRQDNWLETHPLERRSENIDQSDSLPLKFDDIKERGRESIFFMHANYGFMDDSAPAVRFVRERIQTILPSLSEEELPRIEVLATRGFGINALSLPDRTILITPELLEDIEYVEELDGVLLHELNHIAREHHRELERYQKGRRLLGALGFRRYAELEADMIAFYQAQEEQRKTNPRGLLVFMERIRAKEKEAEEDEDVLDLVDLAHGDITDRILNLKIATRIHHLAGFEEELTRIEDVSPFQESLRDLPECKGLDKILEKIDIACESGRARLTRIRKKIKL